MPLLSPPNGSTSSRPPPLQQEWRPPKKLAVLPWRRKMGTRTLTTSRHGTIVLQRFICLLLFELPFRPFLSVPVEWPSICYPTSECTCPLLHARCFPSSFRFILASPVGKLITEWCSHLLRTKSSHSTPVFSVHTYSNAFTHALMFYSAHTYLPFHVAGMCP